MLNDLLKFSDLLAAGTSMVWSNVYGYKNQGKRALSATGISILARLISQNIPAAAFLGATNKQTKNQMVVAVLGILESYMMPGPRSLLRGALEHVAVDLIAEEVFNMVPGLEDRVII